MTSVAQRGRLGIHQRTKNRVMPTGPKLRRLPLGIGRGLYLELDFRHQTRLYLGLYEVELNRHLRRFCEAGVKCFDVGGYLGYDAVVLAKLCHSDVASFECDIANCGRMQRTFVANRELNRHLRVVNARVGARSDESAGVISLDDFAFSPDGFIPDLIKVDIEGDEVAALSGAARILQRRRPHLIVETHGAALEAQCITELQRHGYEPRIVDARRWLRDDRPARHNRWLIAQGEKQVRTVERGRGA
jgi:methyltransferase FkbM-like protein